MRGLRRPRPLVAAVAALSVRSASSSCACVAPPADAAAYDVLLAGDATTATYANLTAAVLAGGGLARAANYTFAAGCGTAADLAACLPAWLDATNWTVVHVGAGADDVAAGASTDTYAADVAALGDVLAATNATVIWGTATPTALDGDTANYNAAALARAGKESEIPNFKGSDLGQFPLALAALPASVVVDDVYGAVADKCAALGGSACYPAACACDASIQEKTARGPRGDGLLAVAPPPRARLPRAGDVPEAQQSIEEVGDEENAFLKFLRVSFVRYYLWLLFDAALVAGGLAAADAAARRLLRADLFGARDDDASAATKKDDPEDERPAANGRQWAPTLRFAFAFAGLVLVFYAALEVSYYFEAAYDDTDCVPKCPAVPGDLDAYDTLLVGDSADAYADGYCGTSYGLLACVDGWLGATNWSVVHFNWGLHDVAPRLYAEVTDYGGNLDALYGKIRSALGPNGTAIWATTTPVPPSYDPDLRTNADVISANAAAADLFGPTGKYPEVVVNDLYGHLVTNCEAYAATACYPETCDCARVQDDGVHLSSIGAVSGRRGRGGGGAPRAAAAAPPRTRRRRPTTLVGRRRALAARLAPAAGAAARRWRRRGKRLAPGDADDYTPLKQGVDPYYGSSRA
ncbi:DUF2263-containing protein [Aureococcus anophagefferens]|nr:DUF2263-containing protein [Aureococcus anophagefferens]